MMLYRADRCVLRNFTRISMVQMSILFQGCNVVSLWWHAGGRRCRWATTRSHHRGWLWLVAMTMLVIVRRRMRVSWKCWCLHESVLILTRRVKGWSHIYRRQLWIVHHGVSPTRRWAWSDSTHSGSSWVLVDFVVIGHRWHHFWPDSISVWNGDGCIGIPQGHCSSS